MKNIFKKRRGLIGLLLLSFGVAFVLYSCGDQIRPHLLNKGNGTPPGQITNVRVENIPGGAHIFYNLPKSENLLYVEAVYFTNSKGRQVAKSSLYSDSLTVSGFADTTPQQIKMYSYNRAGQASKPVTVTIHPQLPIFKKVYKTIAIQRAFGGIQVSFSGNLVNANLAISIVQDSLGHILPVQTHYTSKTKGDYFVHGLQANQYNFGYFVRDQFQNYSDTTFKKITPLFETELNRNKFSNAKFPTDHWQNPSYGVFSYIWDQATSQGKGDSNWWSAPSKTMPIWITIDLGQLAKISRIIFYGEPHYGLYDNAAPKKFALWGSTNPNIKDGVPFDNTWFKYGTYVVKIPVGVSDYIDTPYPQNGVNYQIKDANKFPYSRYLRIEVFSTFAGEKRMTIGDLDIYGDPKNIENNKQ